MLSDGSNSTRKLFRRKQVMAENRGNLTSYRPDIKVMDCTLRDGGLVNNFEFTDEFVKDLYEANVAAGVDFMEFGYKADKDIFDEKEFGKWKFCKEEDIRAIVGENDTPLKISVMADVGRTNIKRDIPPKSESVVDMEELQHILILFRQLLRRLITVQIWDMRLQSILWRYQQQVRTN